MVTMTSVCLKELWYLVAGHHEAFHPRLGDTGHPDDASTGAVTTHGQRQTYNTPNNTIVTLFTTYDNLCFTVLADTFLNLLSVSGGIMMKYNL